MLAFLLFISTQITAVVQMVLSKVKYRKQIQSVNKVDNDVESLFSHSKRLCGTVGNIEKY